MSDLPSCTCHEEHICNLCSEIEFSYQQAERRHSTAAEAVELGEQKRLAPIVLAAVREHLPAEMLVAAERVISSPDGAVYLAALLRAEHEIANGAAGDVVAKAEEMSNRWLGMPF